MTTDGSRDFDFLHGDWEITHERLRERAAAGARSVRALGSALRGRVRGARVLAGSSLNRWKELLTSSSAEARPTHSAPSTDLPGSRSL